MATKIVLVAILMVSMGIPFGGYLISKKKEGATKASLALGILMFFGTVVVADMLLFSGHIYAAETTQAAATGGWVKISCSGVVHGSFLYRCRRGGSECGIRSDRCPQRRCIHHGKGIDLRSVSRVHCIVWSFDFLLNSRIRGRLMKMFLISDNVDTYTGMRLAGVEGVVVHGEEELRRELERVVLDKEIGIVLLTEKFGRDYPAVVQAAKEAPDSVICGNPGSAWNRAEQELYN